MPRQAVSSPKVSRPAVYSQAIRAGNILFIAGQTAVDAQGKPVGVGDPAAQARQVFDNITALLEAAGATWENVVKITSYLTDMRYSDAVREVRMRFLKEPFPASTSVQVVALARPQYLLEVEATAVLD
ncbi:MAG: RidA family protein [Chloroflexi bacterium]|nr:RidA family protein [Chloroflexota bacterium]